MKLLVPEFGFIVWMLLIPFFLMLAALIDVLRSAFPHPNDKLVWVFVIIFLPVLGALLYPFIGRSKKLQS